MGSVIVNTKQHGPVEVTRGVDEAGNQRLFPVNAASLEDWRANKELVPPWLIPSDLVRGGDEFAEAMAVLAAKEETK